jgi:endonuclease YncB( thermonuclease family)
MIGRALCRAAAVASLLLLTPSLRAATDNEPITGPAKVLDGGMIEIATAKGAVRLGLYGIAAPGAHQKCMAKALPWLCGVKATEHLAGLIGRSQVTCGRAGADGDGRPVALCVANGRNLSEQMVRDGWAAADPRQGKDYAQAETAARRAKLGIWQ